MSAYSEVNWGEELGLDLAKLEQERFGSFPHWVMLSEHNKRVKKPRITQICTGKKKRRLSRLGLPL